MTAAETDFLASIKDEIAAEVVKLLREQGLTEDTRPPLDEKQVADRLNISPRSVRTMFDNGQLRTIRVGPAESRRLCEASEVDAYLERRRVAAREETKA